MFPSLSVNALDPQWNFSYNPGLFDLTGQDQRDLVHYLLQRRWGARQNGLIGSLLPRGAIREAAQLWDTTPKVVEDIWNHNLLQSGTDSESSDDDDDDDATKDTKDTAPSTEASRVSGGSVSSLSTGSSSSSSFEEDEDFEDPSASRRRSKRNLKDEERLQILQTLLTYRQPGGGFQLRKKAVQDTAARFGVSTRTCWRLWNRYKSSCGSNGVGGEVLSLRKNNCGRKKHPLSILRVIEEVPYDKRSSLRSLSEATSIPVSTLH